MENCCVLECKKTKQSTFSKYGESRFRFIFYFQLNFSDLRCAFIIKRSRNYQIIADRILGNPNFTYEHSVLFSMYKNNFKLLLWEGKSSGNGTAMLAVGSWVLFWKTPKFKKNICFICSAFTHRMCRKAFKIGSICRIFTLSRKIGSQSFITHLPECGTLLTLT